MLKVYPEAVTAGSSNGVENEIFIPVGDLYGSLTLVNNSPKQQYGRGLLMFSEQLAVTMSPTNFETLGQTISPTTGSGTGLIHTFAYSFSTVLYSSSNPDDDVPFASVLPVATTGTQSGFGSYNFLDIFPNAVKVAANGEITGEGISFVVSDLNQYGVPAFASIDLEGDARQLLTAIWQDIAFNQEVRATGTTSAVTASNLSGTSNVTITAAQLQANNGNIGLSVNQLDNIIASSRTSFWTIQTELNAISNTYDVRVA